jgi:hypothetical protein
MQFLEKKLPETILETTLLAGFSSSPSGAKDVSQLQFMEYYILSGKYTISYQRMGDYSLQLPVIRGCETWGPQLSQWWRGHSLFNPSFYKAEEPEEMPIPRVGRVTRSSAPFLPQPKVHIRLHTLDLPSDLVNLLIQIRDDLDTNSLDSLRTVSSSSSLFSSNFLRRIWMSWFNLITAFSVI